MHKIYNICEHEYIVHHLLARVANLTRVLIRSGSSFHHQQSRGNPNKRRNISDADKCDAREKRTIIKWRALLTV